MANLPKSPAPVPSLPLPSMNPFHPIKYFVNKLNLFTILLWFPWQPASNWSIAGTCLLHTIKLGLLHWRDFCYQLSQLPLWHSTQFHLQFNSSSTHLKNLLSKIQAILSYFVSLSIIEIVVIRVITKLPNSEQSSKGS